MTLVLHILIKDEKSCLRSSWKDIWKKTIEKIIWFFGRWTWQGLALLLRISRWRIKDHVVLKKYFLLENVDIFVFWKFCIFFFGIFELLENMCHTKLAVGQTLKEKENYFWYFLENKCHTLRATGQTQQNKREYFYFLDFFSFFVIFII